MPRSCESNPNNFCYVCGKFTTKNTSENFSPRICRAYELYFGIPVKNQDKPWVPHVICSSCGKYLRDWLSGRRSCLPFATPMLWKEQKDHIEDCYFCINKTEGLNTRKKRKHSYIETPSAQRPRPHDENHPVPAPPMDASEEIDQLSTEEDDLTDPDFSPHSQVLQPHLITQPELNDLVRDLSLSKSQAELLGSRLQQWNLLAKGTKITVFRNRHDDLVAFFSMDDKNHLVYCNDIDALFEAFGIEHEPNAWRLFIDSSKTSLKAVLLHNGNTYPSIPVGYAVSLKETYENIKHILQMIKYERYSWKICADFKVIAIILGMQQGYTKYCCFLCLWDSRDRENHYIKKVWPLRKAFTPGTENVFYPPLVQKENIIIPPLHIKLGLMKNFVKALNREGQAFQYLKKKFTKMTDAKLKEGIFIGPQIKELMNDKTFESTLNSKEKQAWTSMIKVFQNFLGKKKSEDYENLVKNMIQALYALGCKMSLKIHILDSHLDFCPENMGDVSDEHGERFHQDISGMEQRYQGKWSPAMLADYCWTLKREAVDIIYKRKSNILTHF